MAEDATRSGPEEEAASPADQPGAAGEDSTTFSRCARCRHAEQVDCAAGTLICTKHNMRCDAESDAIPDDCPQFEERSETAGG